MNFSNVTPCHGVQSFRNKLLQHGSPMDLPGTCSIAGSSWGHSLLQALTYSEVGSSTGCRWTSPLWTSMDCRGQLASLLSSPWAAGEPLLRCLEHFPPLLRHWLWDLQRCFSQACSLCCCFLLHRVFFFFTFLKNAITEVLPLLLVSSALASRGVCLGASWHWLYQTWGKLLATSHRSHPCSSPPATKILPCKPNTQLTKKCHWLELQCGFCLLVSCLKYSDRSPSTSQQTVKPPP